MGFVQLEDVQGGFECVVFPRLWKQQTPALWQTEKIVLVRGTIDAKGRTPKILVDSATDRPQVTQDAGSRRQEAGSKSRAGSRMQDAGSRMQDARFADNRQSATPALHPQRGASVSNQKSKIEFVDDRYSQL